jgi:hypothetical protein
LEHDTDLDTGDMNIEYYVKPFVSLCENPCRVGGIQFISTTAPCTPWSSLERGHLGEKGYPSSVLMSPSGRPKARALSRRRIILPLRVLGRLSTKVTVSGLAMGPIS